MRPTVRSISSLVLAGLIGVSAVGTGTASARPDGFVPNPPTRPVPLTFAISDAEVVEGDPGDAHVLQFEVTGSRSHGSDVTFRAHTGNLGFEATPGVDFTPVDETVTMPAGATSMVVDVPVTGDLDVEQDAEGAHELVVMWLEDASAGSITDGTALGTIHDDDAPTPPTIHISQETHLEGTGGPTGFHFTVSLSHPSDQPVSLDLVTTPGSATSPGDHQSVPATVVFAPGQTTADYVVSVVGDAVPEGDEEFVVEMSNAQGGTIVGGGGLGTILDDDSRGPGGFTTLWTSIRSLVQLVLALPA